MSAFETIEARLQLSADGFKSAIGNAVNSLGSLESKATGTHKAMGALGVGMAAVAAGGLKKSIGASMDLQSALNESQAIMGDLTQNEMKAMENAAREVGKTTTFSAEEAGEAFYFLASAGMDAEQSVASMGDVAQFAQAGAFDLATATDLATDAQSALGMSSEDAAENAQNLNRVMDVLVKSNTLANASVEEFSQSLTNKAAAAMRQVGMEVEEGASALAVFADQGLKGNRAGTILARTIEGLQSAAQENAGAFEELGVAVYDADGNMRPMADIVEDMDDAMADMSTEQRNAAMEQLGLNERAAQGINLLSGNTDQMREYEGELQNAGGTAEEVANNQLKSLSAQWDIFKSQITDIGISIGNNLLPALTGMLSAVSDAVSVFVKINDATDGWAGTVALLGTLVGGLAIAAGSASAVLGAGGFAMAATAAAGAVGGLATALGILTGPVGWAIGAAALLAMAWKTNFGGIRDHTQRVVDVFNEEFGPAIQWLKGIASDLAAYLGGSGGLSGSLASVGEYIKPLIPLIADGLIWAIRGLADVTRSTISAMQIAWQALGSFVTSTRQFGQNIVAIITQSFNRVKEVITSTLATIQTAAEPYLNYLRVVWIQFSRQILMEARITWQAIKAQIMPVLNWLRTSIPPVLTDIQQKWQQFKAVVVPVVRTLARIVRTVLGSMMSFAETVIRTGLNVITRVWSVFGDDIKAATRMLASTVVTIIGQLLDTIKTVVIVGLRVIRGDWSGAWDAIKDYSDRTTGRISRLISGWVDVMVGYFKTLKSDGVALVRDMMDDVLRAIKDKLSDIKRAGKKMATMLADGIKSAAGKPVSAARDMAGGIRDKFTSSDAKEGPLSDWSTVGPTLGDMLADGMESKASRVGSAAESVAAAARKPFEDLSIYDAISEKHGETSPDAIREMLGRLGHSQRQELADAVASTKWMDKDYQAMAAMRKMAEGGISQGLYDALISQGAGATKLRELLQEGKRSDGPMVRAEDGSMVPKSFYSGGSTGQSEQQVHLKLTVDEEGLLQLIPEDDDRDTMRITSGNLAGM